MHGYSKQRLFLVSQGKGEKHGNHIIYHPMPDIGSSAHINSNRSVAENTVVYRAFRTAPDFILSTYGYPKDSSSSSHHMQDTQKGA